MTKFLTVINNIYLGSQFPYQVYLAWFVAAVITTAASGIIIKLIVFLIMKAYHFFIQGSLLSH